MQLQADSSLEARLFFMRVLKNPRQLGAIAPSSRYLGALLARHVRTEDDSPIIELGGGTGSVTRALIKAGIKPERLHVIELDRKLSDYLKTTLPAVNVIQGDAMHLSKILPSEVIGKAHQVICGLPMINIPEKIQRQILDASFQIMTPGGAFMLYTYSPRSSINANVYKLNKKRLGTIFRNLPPATVWQFTKA